LRDMDWWVFLHAFPYTGNIQGSLQPVILGSVPRVKHSGGSVMVWAEIL
jgi:hypothetical protein